MEKVEVMGVTYFLACRLTAQHRDTGYKRPIDLLFLPDPNGMPIETFVYDCDDEKDTGHHPMLLPADALLLDRQYRFGRPDRKVFLTVSSLVAMVEHRMRLPHFHKQSLDRAVDCVVSLFNTNAIDLTDFVESMIGTPSVLLKRLPRLYGLVEGALQYRLAWQDRKHQSALVEHVALTVQRALQENWIDRVAIPR